MNRTKPSKRPRPSYEEGRVRDSRIEEMLDPAYTKGDLSRLLGKAAKQVPTSDQPRERRQGFLAIGSVIGGRLAPPFTPHQIRVRI